MKITYLARRQNYNYTGFIGRQQYVRDIVKDLIIDIQKLSRLCKVNGIWYFLIDKIVYKIIDEKYTAVCNIKVDNIISLDTSYLCVSRNSDSGRTKFLVYNSDDELLVVFSLGVNNMIGFDSLYIYFICEDRVYYAFDRTSFKLFEIPLGKSNIFNYTVINEQVGCFSGDAGWLFWDFVEQKVLIHINSRFRGWCFDEEYSFGLTARMTKISKYIFLKDYRDYYLIESEFHSPSQTNLLGMGLFLDGELLYYVSGLNPEKKMVLGVMDLTTNECIDEVKIEVEPETYILGLFMCHGLICVLTNKQFVLEYQLVNE